MLHYNIFFWSECFFRPSLEKPLSTNVVKNWILQELECWNSSIIWYLLEHNKKYSYQKNKTLC